MCSSVVFVVFVVGVSVRGAVFSIFCECKVLLGFADFRRRSTNYVVCVSVFVSFLIVFIAP